MHLVKYLYNLEGSEFPFHHRTRLYVFSRGAANGINRIAIRDKPYCDTYCNIVDII